jgi:DNA-binding transcriptional LysR family regulator
MDLRQLECFIAVAEERHFSRAAQRLHLVQSGLSQTIRALEQELGGPLFVRNTRKVDLTPAGAALLPEAQRVLEAAREARLAVTQVHGMARGQLRIGALHGLAHFIDLPSSLGRFRQRFPGIDAQLLLDGALPMLDEVGQGRLDLAFAQPGALAPGVTSRMLACEDMVLVCAPGDPLAAGSCARLADLAGRTFVDLKPDWGMRRLLDRSFAAQGLTRRISFEVNDLGLLTDFVAQGLGLALIPESVARTRAADPLGKPIAVLELAEPEPPCWEIVVAFKGRARQPADRVTAEFLDLMVDGDGGPIQYQD